MDIFSLDAVVIGTGAAGYNAACRLKGLGINSVAIVTEGINCGTSRNTGSDKQTYYKLGLGGDSPDSVYKMAENLFAGGCVDGDTALCEAALSVRSFMNLCELGVAFPVNRYGEYIGYKTDHDPYARATSAGPLTSKFMTEALQKNAEGLGIQIFDGYLAIEILKSGNKACGLLCLETETGELAAFRCGNIITATGGPAGIYADSVYPECHTGSTGLALLAGARLQNLTEWQYGLASVNPRWNVSGTYMQVLPRFVSIDENGNEFEFLSEYFEDSYSALSMVFLKGYQWPFDSKKVLSGSSVIDLAVYRECVIKKRRVFLDFTKNPFGENSISYEKLSKEAYEYLSNAGALFGTPIERLKKMNAPAIELYKSKGIDIERDYLEIALCSQHSNGGIAVDMWWQASVEGLFAAGECAGTHGIARPGGSALNAGQVGSLRAAQYIAEHPNSSCSENEFGEILSSRAKYHKALIEKVFSTEYNIDEMLALAQRRMSDCAAAIRSTEDMKAALEAVREQISRLPEQARLNSKSRIYTLYKLRDILVTQAAVLTAMINYSHITADSRGSAIYYNESGALCSGFEEKFRFSEENSELRSKIQEIELTDTENTEFEVRWREVRPIPHSDGFFENIWASYRKNKNIY